MVPYPIGAPFIEKTALFPRSSPGKAGLKNTIFSEKEENEL